MLDEAEIRIRVNQSIVDEFQLEAAVITSETHLIEDLGLDSLDSVDLIACLERAFKVKCPEKEARKLRTIGDIYGIISCLQTENKVLCA